ncbi:MAG: acyltransferase 3 [Bryobacterales bacterium]|nr:acyltransferase 3 [Bryobacterales bacterium]
MRIFPLYYLYLAFVAGVGLVYGARSSVFHVLPYLATYTYNWFKAFDYTFDNQFVGHLWSLAVEEQFYLLWPLLVWFSGARTFRRIVVAVIVLSPILRVAVYASVAMPVSSWIVYHGTYFQMDGFALGAAIAVFPLRWIRNPRLAFWVVSAAFLAAAFLLNGDRESWGLTMTMLDRFQWVWGYTCIFTASALAILAGARGVPLSRLLESRPLVHLGKVSYGFYVWHFPIQHVFGHFNVSDRLYSPGTLRGWLVCVAYLLTTWLVATLSYNLFEAQFLKLKDRLFAPEAMGQAAVH